MGKIHVNQFNAIGGIQVGVENNVLSVDHLEEMKDEDIEALKNTKTMPVALPSCSYFLGIPYTPARKMIDQVCLWLWQQITILVLHLLVI